MLSVYWYVLILKYYLCYFNMHQGHLYLRLLKLQRSLWQTLCHWSIYYQHILLVYSNWNLVIWIMSSKWFSSFFIQILNMFLFISACVLNVVWVLTHFSTGSYALAYASAIIRTTAWQASRLAVLQEEMLYSPQIWHICFGLSFCLVIFFYFCSLLSTISSYYYRIFQYRVLLNHRYEFYLCKDCRL